MKSIFNVFLIIFTTVVNFGVVYSGITPVAKIDLFRPKDGRVSESMVWVSLQDDLILECHIDQLPLGSKVQWLFESKYSNTDKLVSLNYHSFDANKYKIAEGQRKNSYRLTVKSAEQKDSGKYFCKVYYDQIAPELEKTLNVEVGEKPEISMSDSSTDKTAKQGENVEFSCHANGIPTPYILWKRDGGLTLPNGGEYVEGSILRIDNVQPEARGIYVCEAINLRGKAEMRIQLAVRFRPNIRIDEPEVFQQVGYKKGLTCIISANPQPPKSQVVWSKDGSLVNEGGRFSVDYNLASDNQAITSLMINGVTNDDYGSYTCLASNQEGQGSTRILLSASDTAQADGKTGQILAGSAQVTVSFATVLISLIIALRHNLL